MSLLRSQGPRRGRHRRQRRHRARHGAGLAEAGRRGRRSPAATPRIGGRGSRAAKLGVKTGVLEVDVTDEAACRRMVADTVKQLGRLDILVNNAGINIRKPPQELHARRVAPGDRHQPDQRVHLLAGRLSAR